MRLAGRKAFVTGGGSGIGAAIARRLAAEGADVVVGDIDEPAAREVAGEIDAEAVPLDVADPDSAAAAIGGVGQLDVLVNNAGATVSKPALELTAEDFDRIFAVDVRAAFLLAVAAAKEMRRRGGGVIVNITSVHEHVPRPGFALYAPAKAALGMITRSLALELGPDGIRAVSVAPGAIATERNTEADDLSREIPLGRPGEPEEVAALVSYLVSDEARYVSGASYLIDGALVQQVFET
jgi:NAD(P)-dependent dehydrogenase (short-subunit alcohol dehydrogenase family)